MLRKFFAASALLIGLGTAAAAAPVDPTVGTFGDIASVATTPTNNIFGGSGIPTTATNYRVFTDANNNELLLGLSITPRFSAPTPVNDGNGSFDVEPGLSGGRTKWNFSFYAELTPATNSTLTIFDVGLELLYDLDSAASTDISDLGSINAALFLNTTNTVAQESQNLTFGYLATGIPAFNTPGLNTFSPDFGKYSFLLRANGFGGGADQGVAVIADAGPAPVPLPAGLPLLLAGLIGLGIVRRGRA